MYLGMAYAALGRPETGLPYVQKAAQLDPRNADAAANLAVLQDTLGDFAAAEVSYRRALELDSKRVETVINLAGCLMSQKRYKEAIGLYQQALRSNDSTLLRQRYGGAWSRPAISITPSRSSTPPSSSTPRTTTPTTAWPTP